MVQKSENLTLRQWIFGISTLYHLPMSLYLTTVDFTKSKDPNIWFYSYNRFNVFTCWYNGILALYYPASLYCDWRLKRNEEWPHVQRLNRIRDFAFISVIFPSVTFGGTFFWCLWLYDRELLCPQSLNDVMPDWTHYFIHTYPMIIGLLELIVAPREKPDVDEIYRRVGLSFITFYFVLCLLYYAFGIYVYSFMKLCNLFQLIVIGIALVLKFKICYHTQWYLTNWIHGEKVKTK